MCYFSRLIYSRGVKRAVMSFTTRHRYGLSLRDAPKGERGFTPHFAVARSGA